MALRHVPSFDPRALAEKIGSEHPLLLERIALALDTDKIEALSVFKELLRFLALIGTQQERLTPSLKIDLAWHEFILFTRLYMSASKRTIRGAPAGTEMEPVFYDYRGSNLGDFVFYSLMWSELTHSHGYLVSDAMIVSDDGLQLAEIGSEGFDPNQDSLLDPEVDIDVDTTIRSDGSDYSDSSESSFFDFFSHDSSDGDFSSGDSSSCSSCGGD